MAELFERIPIGNMTVANRLVMPPMATAKAGDGGAVTDEICDYYRDRAANSRIGLIITEHSYISEQGKANPRQVSIAKDSDIPGLQRLTDCIHAKGVPVIAQINHAGSAASSAVTGQAIVGPSAVYHPRKKEELPEELTPAMINEITARFADAARRAKLAGFDGVEIHSAHGYLLNQFYSPLTNHRTDEYGPQSIENRIRFHLKVIRAVREAVGSDYPIIIRLGGCDYTDGGSTIEDCVKACKRFEENGIAMLDLSGGMNGYIRPGHTEPGYFRDMTAAVKKAVSIPVLLTGGITTIADAEAIAAEGCADLIGVGRAIFAKADWAD